MFKKKLFEQLSLGEDSKFTGLTKAIYTIIFISVFWVVLETEKSIVTGNEKLFLTVNYIFGIFFMVEYLIRLYVIGLIPKYAGFKGRIRYVFSFYAVIDLLAFLPLFFFPNASESFLLRLLRVTRIISLLKTSKNIKALNTIIEVIKDKKGELIYSILITLGLVFVSAIFLYLVEADAQPETFGSIPRALWWATITLTTVGYGDVYPITVMGKFLTIILTLAAIGIVAIPAGILASGFSKLYRTRYDQK